MAEKKEDTPFRRGLQFWRSESGEQGEGVGTRWRAAVLRAQSSTSSGSSNQEETPPDSDYHSDTDQPPVRKRKSGANDMHWGPINLRQFMKNWHLYVGLFEYQLRDLVRTGGWDPKTDHLRFASIQAYVPGVPTNLAGKVKKETMALYLTPSNTGKLCCSKEQPQAGPYKPTDRNALDVNYVLYSKEIFRPSNLDIALFSPKFYQSYALGIVPYSSTNPPDTIDMRFEQWKPGMPCLQCKPVNGGPYNIFITVNNATFWLYLDIVGTDVVVRGFQDCPANHHLVRAEFNFQNALLQACH